MQLKTILQLAMLISTAIAAATEPIEPRGLGLGTLRKLKEKCKHTLHDDKSKYVATCEAKNLETANKVDTCILDGIMADATYDCKEMILKVMGVH